MSQRISALEERLGVRLFHRDRHGVTLTVVGRELLPDVLTLVDLQDSLVERLRPGTATGRVRLGVAETYADTLLPDLMRRTRSRYCALELSVVCGSSDYLDARIRARALDLAVVTLPEGASSAIELTCQRMRWVAAPAFAFDQGERVPIAWLSEKCFFRERGLTALKVHGIAFREVSINSEERVVRAEVRSGMAVTIVTENAIPQGLQAVSASAHLPPLGHAPIQLLEKTGEQSIGTLAVKQEIVRTYKDGGGSTA